ncbi:hypothetical protein AAIL08_000546 [Campylobacter upsaliensis]|nr:hypothetical protein [Campylobacter upsaliensis]EIZ1022653.1 hypothetical protein [Campylobacter upsaliensis]ELJ8894564.1 hypothetical protein [Campylobacter upsaliensis]ELU7541788.1 hypothetical protein [Campylobacter upsaliensis]HEC1236819.1 hypothetical protein [Campylobacter upsaliensis]
MRKVLLQILIFSVIFILIFNLTRFLMQLHFIPQDTDKIELLKMYAFGTFHDIRFLSAAFLPLLLCGFLSYFAPLLKIKGGGVVRFTLLSPGFILALLPYFAWLFLL